MRFSFRLIVCLIGFQILSSKNLFRKLSKCIATGCLPLCLGYQNIAIAQDAAWDDRNRLAAEVWRTVDENFYDRTFSGQDWFKLRQEIVKKDYTTDEELYQSISAMLSKIGDKYTRFLPPDQYNTLMNSALGQLCGIGVQLELNDKNMVKIIDLEPDSPAFSSGLTAGDIIINVDGTDTTKLSPEQVAALLRGKEGTKASVRVFPSTTDKFLKGEGVIGNSGNMMESKDYEIIRQPIKIAGVKSSLASVNGQQVGIIRIKSFSSTTENDIAQALDALFKKSDLSAIVLDMRNNAGGLLEGAVQTANLFLPPGKIVVFNVGKDELPRAQQTLPGAIDIDAYTEFPDMKTKLYVLVNENTASAAEVLSAALKENGRAVLVGHQTFGKGLIQTVLPVSQGGVAVTTAKYETPLHNNINKIGLKVDKEIECDTTATAETCAAKFI